MMTKQQALDVVDLLARTPGVMADHAQEALGIAADALRREIAAAEDERQIIEALQQTRWYQWGVQDLEQKGN